MDEIYKAIKFIKKHGYYPDTPIIDSPHDTKIISEGRELTLFASNNYLGMLADKRVINAAKKGAEDWGIGNGSARLLTGNLNIHNELEKKIARFKGKESALTFVSGYMANLGSIPAFANVIDVGTLGILGPIKKKKNTIIFSDKHNHASAIAGIRLGGNDKEIYEHNDIDDLDRKLSKYKKNVRKMIVTDGVFSMDGDIVNLPQLAEVAKAHNALIYLDDAHGTGVLGENGRGTEEHFGLEGASNFIMGTFTKSFGGVGGYVVADGNSIDYLKVSSASFIFTAPIAPPIVMGLIEAIDILEKEPWRKEKLLQNADYLRIQLNKIGFDTLGSETQIIPIMIGDEKKAMKFSEKLLERGFLIPPARWPAVDKGRARLRATVSYNHTKKQIDGLLNVLEDIKKEIRL